MTGVLIVQRYSNELFVSDQNVVKTSHCLKLKCDVFHTYENETFLTFSNYVKM